MQKQKKKEMLTWFCNSDISGSCKNFLITILIHYDSVTILSGFEVCKEIFATVSESALYIDGTMHKRQGRNHIKKLNLYLNRLDLDR